MAQTIIEALPSILCMLAGAGFIIVEVFLPGFGIPGISGILLIGAGTVLAGIHFGALTAIGVLLVLVAILAVLISWVLRAAAHSDGGERIFLRDREELHTKNDDMMAFIGKRGQTKSVLRPAGIGDFDGVRLNVVTEGDYIESGVAVEIVSVEGTRIVVKAVRE